MLHHLKTLLSTRYRRPAVLAAATLLIMNAILPNGKTVRCVEVADELGGVAHRFFMDVNDARLKVLSEQLAVAANPKRGRQADAFYKSKWEMELATIYSNDLRSQSTAESATAEPESAVVTQASYLPHHAATPSNVATTDWAAYWNQVRERSAKNLLASEVSPVVDPVLLRTRLGGVAVLPRSSWFVFLQLAATALTLVFAWRFTNPPSVPRLELHCPMVIAIPQAWFRVRQASIRNLRICSRWQALEISAAIGCALFLLL